jgi:hypothetical protein
LDTFKSLICIALLREKKGEEVGKWTSQALPQKSLVIGNRAGMAVPASLLLGFHSACLAFVLWLLEWTSFPGICIY